jgi:hypothetical protein
VNLERVEKIAEAVLYEGYMLYPYRPSSIKNQQRWNFGVLYPPSWCDRQSGSDASWMQTECLLRTTEATRLTVKVRFLQIVQRSIGKLSSSGDERPFGAEPEYEMVNRLELNERVYTPWQEAVERELTFTSLRPQSLSSLPLKTFTFPHGRSVEHLCDEQGIEAGAIVRQWQTLKGSVQFSAESCGDGLFRVRVQVRNLAATDEADELETAGRDAVLMFSLVSAHTILGAEQGEFVSLFDPPAGLEAAAFQCNNSGTWPVLIGDDAGDRVETVLSSPIILYDFPQIAPESAGNLFDSTEIDEILSLRILTLTDDEKREMRQSDDRSREILGRTENMPPEQFMKLHGAMRGLHRPAREAQ